MKHSKWLSARLIADAIVGAILSEATSHLGRASQTRKWRALDTHERHLERRLGVLFMQIGASFIRRLTEHSAVFEEAEERASVWQKAYAEALKEFSGELLRELLNALRESFKTGTEHAVDALPDIVAFNLDNPRAEEFLREHALETLNDIDTTTRDELRTVFAEARERGWSYDKLAAELQRRFAHWAHPQPQRHIRSRAHLIAVNEIGKAYEDGNLQVAQALERQGLEMQKRWLTVSDVRVDPLCLSYAAQGWQPLDTKFGEELAPPAHPACRCTTEYTRVGSPANAPPSD